MLADKTLADIYETKEGLHNKRSEDIFDTDFATVKTDLMFLYQVLS